MSAPTELPFQRIARALDAYRRNLASVIDWAEPTWFAALLGSDSAQWTSWRAALANAPVARIEACSQAFAQAAGVAAPTFAALTHGALRPGPSATLQPNAALLDVLPVQHGLQVLRMRALSFRRAEARRLIDKRTRAQLSQWAGVGIDRLTQDAHLADAPDIARLAARAAMPPLTTLDAQTLAVEGCALLLRDLGAQSQASGANHVAITPFPLLRLALPRVLAAPAWLAAVPDSIDAAGSARLFARLSELLPEFAWLSG
ncbi:type III secretion system HrpB4-like protein [Paraburkholderia sp. GAS199]|uniref:type III secretion protein HrpB4 n=1 Tax=Paraburkholderia sp. GAS199 TaxID=3035126 RepID=UPI003D1DEAC3